jgi:hypothetical protein
MDGQCLIHCTPTAHYINVSCTHTLYQHLSLVLTCRSDANCTLYQHLSLVLTYWMATAPFINNVSCTHVFAAHCGPYFYLHPVSRTHVFDTNYTPTAPSTNVSCTHVFAAHCGPCKCGHVDPFLEPQPHHQPVLQPAHIITT